MWCIFLKTGKENLDLNIEMIQISCINKMQSYTWMHVHTCYFCTIGTFFFSFKKKIHQEDILSISDVDFKSQASFSLSGWRTVEWVYAPRMQGGGGVRVEERLPWIWTEVQSPLFTKDTLWYHRMQWIFFFSTWHHSWINQRVKEYYLKYF